ncbi:hypothetical protein HanIR_Chr17g0886951 [Helianthus annuus]|nr:hypothetical protein HanIR_Chr17g0886951 [Helianthus annuus]
MYIELIIVFVHVVCQKSLFQFISLKIAISMWFHFHDHFSPCTTRINGLKWLQK